MERMKKWNKGDGEPMRYEYIIAFAILLIASFLFCFTKDFDLTMQHSLLFDTCLVNGKLHRFYSIVNSNAIAGAFGSAWKAGLVAGANYSIINYASYGLVCLPLYIIDKGLKLGLSLVWYQAIIKVLYIFIVMYMCKIMKDICNTLDFSEKKSKWTVLCFLTSPILLYSSIMITHLDIFSVLFVLLGIRALLQKKLKWELIFFMIAVAYKPFALLGILPIVLLTEKRVLYLLRNGIVILAGMFLQSAVYSFDPGFVRIQNYMSKHYNFIERFFASGYDATRNVYIINSSYFVIGFALLCMLAYYTKNVKQSYLFAFPLVGWCIFSLFVQWHPNWLVLMVPFLVLTIATSYRKKLFFILEIVMFTSFLLVIAYGWLMNYDNHMLAGGIIPQILNISIPEGKSLVNFLNAHMGNIPNAIYASVFSASLVCIIIVTALDSLKARAGIALNKKEEYWERGMFWCRLAPLAVFVLFAIYTCI